MKERGWGRIVNLSSGWGAFAEGLEGPTAYSVSKAALNALTVSAAQALGTQVKVNAACPGWVRTRMGGAAAPRSVAEGADTPIWLATLPDDGPTGGFFRDRRRIEW
jgi:NAD(P)-dependent dehydrogenase (short-subunit alcohol dehydrogenase family)